MIDLDLDNDLDRKLHERFFEVYKEHLGKVTHWPPMDLYELFYRAGRVDARRESLARLMQSSGEDPPEDPPTQNQQAAIPTT